MGCHLLFDDERAGIGPILSDHGTAHVLLVARYEPYPARVSHLPLFQANKDSKIYF